MSAWQQLEINSPASHVEMISNLLHELGALSVSLVDGGAQPLFQVLPEETPLWNHTKILALFSEDTNLLPLIEQLKQEIKQPFEYVITPLEEQDWVRQTQQNFPPRFFAPSLWVLPSWCRAENYAGQVIKIDPGLAFGTGTHPTTSLCLEWLAENPPQNSVVIDYGAGSGILALAASALGANSVFAIDHDVQAIQACENNAKLNAMANKQFHILLEKDMPNIKASVIIANILSQALITLAPRIISLTTKNATLILSGILVTEINTVIEAYAPHFKVMSAKTQDEWVRLELKSQI